MTAEQFPIDLTTEAIEATVPVIERALAWSGRRQANKQMAHAIREALRAGGSISLRVIVDSGAAPEPRGRVFIEARALDGRALPVGEGELSTERTEA